MRTLTFEEFKEKVRSGETDFSGCKIERTSRESYENDYCSISGIISRSLNFEDAIISPGLYISNAVINGSLNLTNAIIGGFHLNNVVIRGDLLLKNAAVSHGMYLKQVAIDKGLFMDGMVVSEGLKINQIAFTACPNITIETLRDCQHGTLKGAVVSGEVLLRGVFCRK